MEVIKKGNHAIVKSDSVDKEGKRKEYRVTPLLCPTIANLESSLLERLTLKGDSKIIHWLCNCPDFMMGRISRGINPLEAPCKHIEFLLAQDQGQATS